jgi:hypothetical protein
MLYGAKISIITPLQGYEELRFGAEAKVERERVEGMAELYIPSLTYSVAFHGNIELAGNTKRISGKGNVKGTDIPAIEITVEHAFNTQKKEFQTKVEAGSTLFHPLKMNVFGRRTRNDIVAKMQASLFGESADCKFRAKSESSSFHARFLAVHADNKIEAELNTQIK